MAYYHSPLILFPSLRRSHSPCEAAEAGLQFSLTYFLRRF
jgi:hypothetical protein